MEGKAESVRLQVLVASLHKLDLVKRVRLVRIVHKLYLEEHPERAEGKAQANGMNEARKAKKAGADVTPNSTVTFTSDMARRLGCSASSVEKLIAKGKYIPNHVLKAVGRNADVKGKGMLLDRLERRFRDDGPSLDWQQVVQHHISPPIPVPIHGLLFAGPESVINTDSRSVLNILARKQYKFDCVLMDPPYGLGRDGRLHGLMTDDAEGSLWVIPMLAKLAKPHAPLCVWVTEALVGRWTVALLDAGFQVAEMIRWDKDSAWHAARGNEVMLVAAVGGAPTTYNEDVDRVWTLPTLGQDAEEREVHDTPKPVELMERALVRYSKPGQLILDPFAGTGPVGRAARRLGRSYLGCELDPISAEYAGRKIRAESTVQVEAVA